MRQQAALHAGRSSAPPCAALLPHLPELTQCQHPPPPTATALKLAFDTSISGAPADQLNRALAVMRSSPQTVWPLAGAARGQLPCAPACKSCAAWVQESTNRVLSQYRT